MNDPDIYFNDIKFGLDCDNLEEDTYFEECQKIEVRLDSLDFTTSMLLIENLKKSKYEIKTMKTHGRACYFIYDLISKKLKELK